MRVKSQTDLNYLIGGKPKTPTQRKLVDAFLSTQEAASKAKNPSNRKKRPAANPGNPTPKAKSRPFWLSCLNSNTRTSRTSSSIFPMADPGKTLSKGTD